MVRGKGNEMSDEGKPVRQTQEKDALTAHRFRNWVVNVKGELANVDAARQAMEAAAQRLAYAYLEAREEQEKLIDAGLSKIQVDAIALLPTVPIDAISILHEAGVIARGPGGT